MVRGEVKSCERSGVDASYSVLPREMRMVHADYKISSTAYAQLCPRGLGTYIARVFDIALLGLSFAPRRWWRGSQD